MGYTASEVVGSVWRQLTSLHAHNNIAPHLVLVVDISPSIQKFFNCLHMSLLSSFYQGSRMSALQGRMHGEEGEGKCVEAAHITT